MLPPKKNKENGSLQARAAKPRQRKWKTGFGVTYEIDSLFDRHDKGDKRASVLAAKQTSRLGLGVGQPQNWQGSFAAHSYPTTSTNIGVVGYSGQPPHTRPYDTKEAPEGLVSIPLLPSQDMRVVMPKPNAHGLLPNRATAAPLLRA